MGLIAHGVTVVGWMTEPFDPVEELVKGSRVTPKVWAQAVELAQDPSKVKVTEQATRLLMVHAEGDTCHLCRHLTAPGTAGADAGPGGIIAAKGGSSLG
jgi:hypothetical protein